MSSAPQQPSSQQRSLYRRHRPRTFADVVGQEPVVRTLRNAVERDKVHHAYLFVGSRGTGKTSMAKILAACLNCERGRGVQPCGVCESCMSIAEARSLDVIEMDAASNNSVEDIRELRDSVAYAPLTGRAKVYILDEAHMLSTAAWNAFLKTLEEPPPNTVFVLATTEAQKVPATVVDRCHRFDFQRPTVEQVATVLRKAAQSESIAIPPEAVAALARAASGSFRDALGTLEQLLTYSGPEIELDDVLAVLGVADSQLLERVIDAVASADAKSVLVAVEECASSGRDPGAFASDLETRARELIVVGVLEGVPPELSLTEELDERLASQAQRVPETVLVRLLDLLAAAAEAVKAGGDARTQVELALLKAAKPEVDPSTKALLARIERLEAGGPVASVNGPSGGSSLTPPAEVPGAPSLTPRPEVSGEFAGPSLTLPGEVSGESAGESLAPSPDVSGESAGVSLTLPREVSGEPAGAPQPPAAAQPPAHVHVDGIAALQDLWPAIVDLVRSRNALIGAVIEETRPTSLREGVLTVAFPSSASFNRKRAEDQSYRAAIGEAISQLAGLRVKLAYELSDEPLPQALSNGPADVRSEEEIVKRIIVEFDAEELPDEAAAGAQAEEGE